MKGAGKKGGGGGGRRAGADSNHEEADEKLYLLMHLRHDVPLLLPEDHLHERQALQRVPPKRLPARRPRDSAKPALDSCCESRGALHCVYSQRSLS